MGDFHPPSPLKSHINANKLAELSGRSKQNISQIINGKLFVNPCTLRELFQYVNKKMTFNFDLSTTEEYEHYLDECFEELCFSLSSANMDQRKQYLDKKYYYSYNCFNYLLLECLDCFIKEDYSYCNNCNKN